jgi:hypothetical protein
MLIAGWYVKRMPQRGWQLVGGPGQIALNDESTLMMQKIEKAPGNPSAGNIVELPENTRLTPFDTSRSVTKLKCLKTGGVRVRTGYAVEKDTPQLQAFSDTVLRTITIIVKVLRTAVAVASSVGLLEPNILGGDTMLREVNEFEIVG